MEEVTLVNSPELLPGRGYSHAAVAGHTVWVAGQASVDASGNVVHDGDMAAQTGRALRNIQLALKAAGSSPSQVVKMTYLVLDIDAYKSAMPEIAPLYREIFGNHFPPATIYSVGGLLDSRLLVEVECVAVRG